MRKLWNFLVELVLPKNNIPLLATEFDEETSPEEIARKARLAAVAEQDERELEYATAAIKNTPDEVLQCVLEDARDIVKQKGDFVTSCDLLLCLRIRDEQKRRRKLAADDRAYLATIDNNTLAVLLDTPVTPSDVDGSNRLILARQEAITRAAVKHFTNQEHLNGSAPSKVVPTAQAKPDEIVHIAKYYKFDPQPAIK